ncbi:Cellulose synthase-like protein H2 [Nymphaea thermarum]|nr:Cellulose synthase-like protein H2 [Nymphaea thermarum]
MKGSGGLPLQERVEHPNTVERLFLCIHSVLILCLLLYRLAVLPELPGGVAFGVWLAAFLCECWFAFIWVLSLNCKWHFIEHKTFPDRLLQRFKSSQEFPAMDVFVTTADPVMEPPIITVNTVLSILAVDYPASKIACYVSDDGCSPITFFSLIEASKFAHSWVPFCKKYGLECRAPFNYFSLSQTGDAHDPSSAFHQDWKETKGAYEELVKKIAEEAKKSIPDKFSGDEFSDFARVEKRNHPSIVKARVSGVMTNAPFMLNLDCDMFVNNPKALYHALCLLLGFEFETRSGFVQFPQTFHGALKDDPYGNQYKVLNKVRYSKAPRSQNGRCGMEEALAAIFGRNQPLFESALRAGRALVDHPPSQTLSSSLEAAIAVSACDYEDNTLWGKQIGWDYGSTAEDVMTGCRIHSSGWNSIACLPEPPAFLGAAPSTGPDTMVQQKRWATGLLEALISRRNPVKATLRGKLQLRQCMVYLIFLLWAVRSVPELCYAILPALCIFTNTSIFPKITDPEFRLPAAVFIIFNLYILVEYLLCGLSVREWWNNQRMARIVSSTAWLFGLLAVLLKMFGISETVFELTRKDDLEGASTEAGKFIFDSSAIYVPATTLLFVNLAALALGLAKVVMDMDATANVGELVCCAWVVMSFLPFVKGLFRCGQHVGSRSIGRETILGPPLTTCHVEEEILLQIFQNMLNLDCDMFVNYPKVMCHALCLLLGSESETRSGFVQFPQTFHGALKDDPYGNQYKVSTKIGWDYGSTTEDVMTGLRIQSSGWNSIASLPEPPAFLGAAPSTGPDTMVQQKRWATGLLEALISRRSPVKATVRGKLQLRQCMVYLVLLLWAVRSVPELCYAILPAFCLFTNTSIFPKITDPEFKLAAAVFIIFNVYTLVEYLLCGLSLREWWNNQRMARIVSSTAWLFGLLAVLLKVFGISEMVFELTRKDDLEGASPEAGKFIFDSSAIYVPATTLLFVNMTALALGLAKMVMEMEAAANVGELACCAWVVLSFLPFVKGLFRRGQHGIPWPTICKSGTVTLIFVCLCRWFSN